MFAHFFPLWVSFAALWSERLIASVFFSASVNFHFVNVWYHAFLSVCFPCVLARSSYNQEIISLLAVASTEFSVELNMTDDVAD